VLEIGAAADYEEVARRAQHRTWQHASCLIGPDLTFRWASSNIALVIGWELSDLEGMAAYELLHPDDLDGVMRILSAETDLNPLWRADVRRRMILEIRVRRPGGDYTTLECTLTNLLADPEVGMLLLNIALPSQFRYVDSAVELTRIGGDIGDVLSLIADQFTPGTPSQPAVVIFDHDGEVMAASANAPEPYGPVPVSTYVDTWDVELFESTHVESVGLARFWSPSESLHPFDVESGHRMARQAALAIGRHRATMELEHAAHNDVLTGIANRRALEHELDRRLSRNDEVLLAYLDLNGFKEINDRLGHAAGDHVLRIVAERLAASLRSADIAARIGGDEFVLLFGAPAPATDVISDRIALAVNAPIEWGDQVIQISASVGFGSGTSNADGLLRSADRAMLLAKHGR
jgi:diguanylate cyclase (GGDEF)-like protein